MPSYIEKALPAFKFPHSHNIPPTPGQQPHMAMPYNSLQKLTHHHLWMLQEPRGSRKSLASSSSTIDSTMLVALGTLASAQSKGTQATAQAATQLLNYCATHPDAAVYYHAGSMGLHAHSNASYLSKYEARSCIGGIFFLSDCASPTAPAPTPTVTRPPFYGAILVTSSILKSVMSSATKAETGAFVLQCKRGLSFTAHP